MSAQNYKKLSPTLVRADTINLEKYEVFCTKKMWMSASKQPPLAVDIFYGQPLIQKPFKNVSDDFLQLSNVLHSNEDDDSKKFYLKK